MSDKRYPHPEIVIAIMGPTGAGKSSFVNTVTGSVPVVRKSSGLHGIEVSRWVTADGHVLNIIDTPGFHDSHDDVTEVQVLRTISRFLNKERAPSLHTIPLFDVNVNPRYNGPEKRLTGLIYIQPINTALVTGSPKQNLHVFQELCGSQSLKNIVVATNKWDLVDLTVGAKRELEFKSEEPFFKSLIEAGAVMIRHTDNLASASKIIAYLLGKESVKTGIIDELFALLGKGGGDSLSTEQAAIQARTVELEHVLVEERRKSEAERSRLERQKSILDDQIRVLSEKREEDRIAQEKAMRDAIEAKDRELTRILDEQRRSVEAERASRLETQQHSLNPQVTSSNNHLNASGTFPDSEPMVVIMGPAGAGKSSFIKLITGSEEVRVRDKLESEAHEVRVIRWVSNDGRVLHLADTPAFNDSGDGTTGAQPLRIIANFLLDESKRDNRHLSGLIYVHPISDDRVTGSARRTIRMFTALCGSQALQHVIIITSKWDMIGPAEGARREKELMSKETLFKPLIDGRAVMLRQDNGLTSASRILSYLYGGQPVKPMIVDELLSGKTLAKTSAGQVINEEIQSLLKKSQDDNVILQREMLAAIKTKDTELQGTLEEERKARERERARLENMRDILRSK